MPATLSRSGRQHYADCEGSTGGNAGSGVPGERVFFQRGRLVAHRYRASDEEAQDRLGSPAQDGHSYLLDLDDPG